MFLGKSQIADKHSKIKALTHFSENHNPQKSVFGKFLGDFWEVFGERLEINKGRFAYEKKRL